MNDFLLLYFIAYVVYLWLLLKDTVADWDRDRKRGHDTFGWSVFLFMFYGVFLGFIALPIMIVVYFFSKRRP